jgi:Domain of unknown function (DUF1990)
VSTGRGASCSAGTCCLRRDSSACAATSASGLPGYRVTDEERDSGDGPERVWGWRYQTLEGHIEQGRLSYEVIKNLTTGQVAFRVVGYSRRAPIANPVIRWGFMLFGRWTQQRFYRNIQARMAALVAAAQRGQPVPSTRPNSRFYSLRMNRSIRTSASSSSGSAVA